MGFGCWGFFFFLPTMILWFVNSQVLSLPHFSTCRLRSVVCDGVFFFALLKTYFCEENIPTVSLVKSSVEALTFYEIVNIKNNEILIIISQL